MTPSPMTAVVRTFALFALTFASLPSAHAWGADGHRLIAQLAEAQLTSPARAEVDRLLSQEAGATLTSVATWADEIRRPGTAPLHYVNLPEGDCVYSRKRDCPDGRCLVEAIRAQLTILKSSAPDTERLTALKWVTHLVGDVHQPLHAGLAVDKGGNLHQVQAFGRGSNLHAVWDKDLIRHREGGLNQLLQDMSNASPKGSSAAAPALWVTESCAVRSASEFYPGDRTVGAAYAADWDHTLVAQLALAGRRLAEVLNSTLRAR